MSRAADLEALRSAVEPVVTGAGLDLEDVVVTPAGRRRVVKIVVDRDGGVGLDAVAEVSSAVSAALDSTDVLGGASYVLEVTSPGVDRPLTEPRHWRRAQGRLVTATLADGTSTKGRVGAAGADDVTLRLDDGTETRIPLDRVVSGRVEVEFNRPTSGGEG
jgi:ribosome maturation factor RimP